MGNHTSQNFRLEGESETSQHQIRNSNQIVNIPGIHKYAKQNDSNASELVIIPIATSNASSQTRLQSSNNDSLSKYYALRRLSNDCSAFVDSVKAPVIARGNCTDDDTQWDKFSINVSPDESARFRLNDMQMNHIATVLTKNDEIQSDTLVKSNEFIFKNLEPSRVTSETGRPNKKKKLLTGSMHPSNSDTSTKKDNDLERLNVDDALLDSSVLQERPCDNSSSNFDLNSSSIAPNSPPSDNIPSTNGPNNSGMNSRDYWPSWIDSPSCPECPCDDSTSNFDLNLASNVSNSPQSDNSLSKSGADDSGMDESYYEEYCDFFFP